MRLSFKVSARTARLIGRENVANAEAAIIELVKNSYDADADYCYVAIDDENDTLYIIDNGSGMTSSVIQKHWMVIGTQNKLHNYTSKKGRIQTGAKGIGRFALDRLGNSCTLHSKVNRRSGIKWNVDWSAFDEKSTEVIGNVTAELIDEHVFSLDDEIDNILGTVSPEYVLNSGTIFCVNGLRDKWDRESIRDLYRNLEALIPPKEEKFKLFLYDLNNLEEFGEVLPAICDDYDYKLEASITSKVVELTINRNEHKLDVLPNELFDDSTFPFDKKTFSKGYYTKKLKVIDLLPGFDDSNDTLKDIGDFNLTFYFMKLSANKDDKEKFLYRSVDTRRRSDWLKVFGGVKIFRDNFRVRPYGETNSSSWDWLQLGSRRASSPAAVSRAGQYRMGPQNIVGSIHISRSSNKAFDDKSSREGLQDSTEFKIFKNMVLSILSILENDRSYIASKLLNIYNKNHEKEKVISDAKKKAKEIVRKVRNKREEDFTLEEKLAISVEAQEERILALKEEQRLIRVFASIGLTVSSFAHELGSIDRKLVSRFDELEKLFKPFAPKKNMIDVEDYLNPYILLEDNKNEDKKIKQWLNYTLESIKKDKRKRKNLNFNEYFSSYKKSWAFTLKERHIDLTVNLGDAGRSIIRAFEIDMDTIFNNLLINSLDAYYRKVEPHLGDNRKIIITIKTKDKHVQINYRDNGPGLSTSILNSEDIFKPLYTTKKDRYGNDSGTGLGMWLVKNVAEDYIADVSLGKAQGFSINFLFPLRKNYWNV